MPLGKVFPTSITETSLVGSDLAGEVGVFRVEGSGVYILAKAAEAIKQYDCCTYVDAESAGTYGTTIIVDMTDAVTDWVWGVAPVAVAINEYFWLQVAGIATVTSSATTITANTAVSGSATAGAAEDASANDAPFGMALEAAADTVTTKVYLYSWLPGAAPLTA